MAALGENREQLAEGGALLDRDDFGAPHHDLLDPELLKGQGLLQHGAFGRAECVAIGVLQRLLDHRARDRPG